MPLNTLAAKVQKHLLIAERRNTDPVVAMHLKEVHALLEQGVQLYSHELTARGVDVQPLSGGGNKPPVEE